MKVSHSLIIVCACILASCASYKMHVTNDEVPAPLGTNVIHRVFLIGDAGATTERQQDNLALLKERIVSSDIPATVVFLGDNVYPLGMPRTDDATRAASEAILLSQMRVAEETGAQAYFIQGNHDWHRGRKGGLKAARRAGKFVKDYGRDDVELLPEDGCPGPEAIELTDHVVMILFDSQWWLQDWSAEKDINEDCDVASRLDFLKLFDEMLKDYQDKRIIVAMHHPFISSGPHGGYFTVKDHLFPLTNISPGLWLPLPVIGSIYPIYRANFGHVQDHTHPKYHELITGIREAADAYDNVIFVSGHEHAVEYHRDHGQHYIVSGSGAKISPIAKQSTQLYGHAAGGFVQLDLIQNGAVDMAIWEPASERGVELPAFTCNVAGEKERLIVDPDLPEDQDVGDSTTAYLSQEYEKSGLYRFLFGERYRALYSQTVTVRNMHLATDKGGLKPVKRGGGFQTNSLRLESPDDKEYVLRSINKDATRLLPEIFQSTFAVDILQDQFTASNPYGAFVIPGMADAAGIYHTNPEAVFLPKQKALGKYAEDFGGDFYLFEERPDGDWTGYENFGGSEDIMSYSDMIEKTREDDDDQVDQQFVLRSRLFDMFIGDWDRHDDQWRWAEFDDPDGKGKIFRPIPRDRDQAFSTYDGAIVKLANWYTPTLRKMTVFEDDIKRINWFNFNARYFDRDFMNELTADDWQTIAQDLKTKLTDEVIDASLANWPDEIYHVQGDYIASTLKARRDNLPEFARRYYAFLAEEVTISGTEDADYFLITRGDGNTRVQVYDSNKEGEKQDLYYDRTFLDDETREVRIYGEEGHDHFETTGGKASRIKIRIIGGPDSDNYITGSSGNPQNVKVYDRQDEVPGVRYTKLHDAEDNLHDRLAYKYNYALPLLVIGGNPDDGFLFGGGVQWIRHGFLKAPYASKQSISGFYAFGSGSYGFNYDGEFRLPMSKTSISLSGVFEGPSYVQNFFGLGNDSEDTNDDIDYYRVRKRNYAFIPGLLFGNERGSRLGLHLGVRSQKVERTSGRFIADADHGLPESVFEERNDALARIEYSYELLDNPLLPRRGIKFGVTGGLDYAFDEKMTHRFFEGSLAMYFQLKTLGKPTIATRVGAAIHGGQYQFYQGALLGSHDNFRGVHKQRFTGDKMFYHNTDIRFRLTNFRNYYIPAAMGIVLNFDHGRVWLEGEESDTWHYAYGGGVWVSPFQTLMLSLNYNVSDVDERISLGMGFFF